MRRNTVSLARDLFSLHRRQEAISLIIGKFKLDPKRLRCGAYGLADQTNA